MESLYPQIPRKAMGTYDLKGEQGIQAINSGLEIGFRHIDCAQFYANEEVVGSVIGQTTVPREQLFVTSKVWVQRYRDIKESVVESINKLQSEYLDLMLLHAPVPVDRNDTSKIDFIPMRDVWRQLEQCVDEGLIKHIGVSNWWIPSLYDLTTYASIPPAVNQIEINPYWPQKVFLDNMAKLGVLAFGFGTIGSPWRSTPGQRILLEDPVVLEISQKHNITPSQVLVNYGLQRGYGTVTKSQNPERIRQIFEADRTPIGADDLEKLLNIGHTESLYNDVPYSGTPWSAHP